MNPSDEPSLSIESPSQSSPTHSSPRPDTQVQTTLNFVKFHTKSLKFHTLARPGMYLFFFKSRILKKAMEKNNSAQEEKFMADAAKLNSLSIRYNKFKTMLQLPNVDIEALKKLSWAGIPDEIRPIVWKLLMGIIPANQDRREATQERKRKEYQGFF